MTSGVLLRGTAVTFVAAMLQIVIVSSLLIGGGAPDLLLVVVVVLGLLRGSIAGAGFGFETTAQDRRVAPLVAVGTITVLAGVFGFVLQYMLGEAVVARHSLVTALLPAVFLNLILALPLYLLVRALVGEGEGVEAALDVEVVAP